MFIRKNIVTLSIGLLMGVGAFFVSYHLTIHQAPKDAMTNIQNRIAKRAGGWNKCSHNRKFGPLQGGANRANPDSIISIMAYDLSDGPVNVSGETWPDYWSLSLYEQNSDNYFVINDRQLPKRTFKIQIAFDKPAHAQDGVTHVMSPSKKGIMLVRRFATSKAAMEGILENQDKMYCGTV